MSSRFIIGQLKRLEQAKVPLEKRLAYLEGKFAEETLKFEADKAFVSSQIASLDNAIDVFKASPEYSEEEAPVIAEEAKIPEKIVFPTGFGTQIN